MTTPEHPFAKVGAGWTRAADLTRGDRVETAGGGNTTVLGAEIREVQPTAVYNLTVSKTHSYFVGPKALLVHNTDCGSPSAGSSANRKRKREEADANELREQFRARRAEHKALIEARWRALKEMRRRPFNDMPGRPNCGYCVLAALRDLNKVSTLFEVTDFDPRNPNQKLNFGEMIHSMRAWGLTSDRTPPWKPFPDVADTIDAARKKSEDDPRSGKPRPTFPFSDGAKSFMETSSASTFAVGFQYFNGDRIETHTLLAVKRDDGSILYVDLQKNPPKTYDNLDPHISLAVVFPTDIDWRANHQISNAVENRRHVPRHTTPYSDPSDSEDESFESFETSESSVSSLSSEGSVGSVGSD